MPKIPQKYYEVWDGRVYVFGTFDECEARASVAKNPQWKIREKNQPPRLDNRHDDKLP